MKPLPSQFNKDQFSHRILERRGNVALLEKTKESIGFIGYEVVKIQSHNGYEFMGRWVEPAEFMPRSEDWGVNGFTFKGDDLEGARHRMDLLLSGASRSDASEFRKKKIQLKIKIKLKK